MLGGTEFNKIMRGETLFLPVVSLKEIVPACKFRCKNNNKK
jgi:hypothetical protein